MAKVLVVEDDSYLRFLFGEVVEELGHTAVPAENGLAALEWALENPDLDMILTDVIMPEMNGQDMVKRIKQMPDLGSVPILFISGIVDPDDIEEMMDGESVEFAHKPLSEGKIREFIERNASRV